ncbi:hypothetical protein [Streptomyces phaeochromogenes]
MTFIQAATVRDAVALISGAISDPEPVLDRQLQDVVADLEAADALDVVSVFAGVVVGLLSDLSTATLTPRADLWQDVAARITERLGREAPDTDGGHHG